MRDLHDLGSPDAGAEAKGPRQWERRAADDLAHFIERMTGAKPTMVSDKTAVDAALGGDTPVFVVGELALSVNSSLRRRLEKTKNPNAILRADAIVVTRKRDRIYLAGSNDDSHYHAVAWLLRHWGCRFYIPTEIGECVPEHPALTVGKLDHAYAPPFEIRKYWISWNGIPEGQQEFMHRNFMNTEFVPSGHVLGKYVKDLVPEGRTHYNVPIADPKTAEHVASQLEEMYAAGKRFNLGMEDGVYDSDHPDDVRLRAGLQDKYFLKPSLADPFMVFYNNVARILRGKYPDSNAKIGFLAHANITLPPQREIIAEPPLIAYLAPIDVDPNHGIGDPESPPRNEYGAMMRTAAEPMARFWNAIFAAWEDTTVTEHEYMAAPAIYTPGLMRELSDAMAAAEKAVTPLAAGKAQSRNDKLYVQRMQMARAQWRVLDGYMRMVFAAASDADFAKAASIGNDTMAARLELGT